MTNSWVDGSSDGMILVATPETLQRVEPGSASAAGPTSQPVKYSPCQFQRANDSLIALTYLFDRNAQPFEKDLTLLPVAGSLVSNARVKT